MSQSFADLGISKPVIRALARRDITNPFPVQQLVIRDALAGHGIYAIASGMHLDNRFARGGVDYVKDDHGLADQAYSPLAVRCEAVAAALRSWRYLPTIPSWTSWLWLKLMPPRRALHWPSDSRFPSRGTIACFSTLSAWISLSMSQAARMSGNLCKTFIAWA